jgi:microcystin degradation protein MlrC
MSSTFVEPCKSIYKELELYNQQNDIIDCNLMVGYVWADTPRATASSIVTCTNQIIGSEVCQSIAKSYWSNRYLLESDMATGSIKDAITWTSKDFSIIADSGDNPTAGGVGDRADILEEVLKQKIRHTLFAGIASKLAYEALKDSNEFTLGGTYGGGGPSLKLKADHVYFKNDCAIASLSSTVVIITKLRRPFHNLKDFTDLKIDLKDFKTLIVKSGYLSPDLQSLSAPTFMALTSGAVNQDIKGIENNNRLQKIYPFQEFNDYSPVVSNGEHLINQ